MTSKRKSMTKSKKRYIFPTYINFRSLYITLFFVGFIIIILSFFTTELECYGIGCFSLPYSVYLIGHLISPINLQTISTVDYWLNPDLLNFYSLSIVKTVILYLLIYLLYRLVSFFEK